MVILVYLSLLVCLLGLAMFCLSSNAKASQIGWEMFRIGLLVFLFCSCSNHFQLAVGTGTR